MKIWIDADGCPVTKETVEVAKTWKVPVVIVSNHAHHFEPEAFVEVVTVDKSADRVDFVITNRLAPGDLVISQDYGLHAMVIARGGLGLQVSGEPITAQNIDDHLMRRHVHREARRKDNRYTQFKKRDAAADRRFVKALKSLLAERLGRG